MKSRSHPFDRAIVYALAGRAWQFVAGGLSLWMISEFLSPTLQGFYYTILSLLTVQTLFDLGLSSVLIYVASHEWGVAEDETHSDRNRARQRLALLIVRARRWYRGCAVIFMIAAGVIGWVLLSRAAPSETGTNHIDWRLPWVSAVIFTGSSLLLAPSISVLEGCNRMGTVNAFRLWQAVVGNLAVWITLGIGGELWAAPVSAAVRLTIELLLVRWRFRTFFHDLRGIENDNSSTQGSNVSAEPPFSWKNEVLPLQWRAAAGSLAGYVAIGVYTPIIFEYHGAIAAGRIGMSWNVVIMLQNASLAWVVTRTPQIGRLLSDRNESEARRLLRRYLGLAATTYVIGCSGLIAALLIAERFLPALADRLLPVRILIPFVIGAGVQLVVLTLGGYVRTHKIDPLLKPTLLLAFLLGVGGWWAGRQFGSVGIGTVHALAMTLVGLPIFLRAYLRTHVDLLDIGNADSAPTGGTT